MLLLPSLLLSLLPAVLSYNAEEELLYDHFPDDFMWGAATAAYQIEVNCLTTETVHNVLPIITGWLGCGWKRPQHLGCVHQGQCRFQWYIL